MKAVVVTSIVCSTASVLGLLALSAMTIAPGREGWRSGTLLTVAVLLVAWLVTPLWARWQFRVAGGAVAVPRAVSNSIVVLGTTYFVVVLLSLAG